MKDEFSFDVNNVEYDDSLPEYKKDNIIWCKELEPLFNRQKSFYKKAYVRLNDHNGYDIPTYELYSYDKHVMDIDFSGNVTMYHGEKYNSLTTRRHKKEFMLQHNVDPNEYL